MHRHTSALRRGLRRHRTAPMLAMALAASAIGVWLSAGSPAFEVGSDAAGLHVDDVTLSPVAEFGSGHPHLFGCGDNRDHDGARCRPSGRRDDLEWLPCDWTMRAPSQLGRCQRGLRVQRGREADDVGRSLR